MVSDDGDHDHDGDVDQMRAQESNKDKSMASKGECPLWRDH